MLKKIILLASVIMSLLSCSAPKAVEYKTYHNFSINQLGFNTSSISLDLEYYNPNNFGMQLKNTDLDIFIDGNLLGHSVTDSLIQIPRRGNFTVPVKFNIDMRNAFRNALNTLTGKEVLVKLAGKVKVGKGNVFMNFPINYESKQTFSMF